MLLPICSCGVIPLGLGLYYSGAYLGPPLAFMTATPIINPAAILLAYGFFGPQLATIYLMTGFVVPFLIGIIGNALAGTNIHAPGMDNPTNPAALECDEQSSLAQKLRSGLHWGFFDMGVSVSKYVFLGMLLAGLTLDIQMRQNLQEELAALWIKDKTTVIMVTHDVDEAIYLSDRVIVMSSAKGRIIEDLPIRLDRPRNRNNKQFLNYREHLTDVLRIALGRSTVTLAHHINPLI